MDMKRKRRKPVNQEAQVPAWVLDDAPKPTKPTTKKELDDLAANVRVPHHRERADHSIVNA